MFLSILLGAILKGLTFQKLDVCVCMFCFIFVQGLILWVWLSKRNGLDIYEKSFETCACLWQSSIILRWPSAADRMLKCNYLHSLCPLSPSESLLCIVYIYIYMTMQLSTTSSILLESNYLHSLCPLSPSESLLCIVYITMQLSTTSSILLKSNYSHSHFATSPLQSRFYVLYIYI